MPTTRYFEIRQTSNKGMIKTRNIACYIVFNNRTITSLYSELHYIINYSFQSIKKKQFSLCHINETLNIVDCFQYIFLIIFEVIYEKESKLNEIHQTSFIFFCNT